MNKKGFTGRDYILATLLFSFVVAVFFIMMGSMANEYENTDIIDSNFNNSFNKFEENTDKAGDMLESLTSGEGLKFVDAAELFLAGGFVVINLILSSITVTTQQVLSFGTYFGVPTEISILLSTFILASLVVILVFVIINSVRGGKEL